MGKQENTLGGLVRHLLKNAWWIIIVALVGAGVMFMANRHSAPTAEWSASRLMYIGHANYNKSQDPESSLKSDLNAIKTYIAVQQDMTIAADAVQRLHKAGFKRVTVAEVRESVELEQKKGTLIVRVHVLNDDEKEAIAIANNYADAFAANGPKVVPGMPTPRSMRAIQGAANTDGEKLSNKKAAIYGGAAGLGLGVILAMFTGIAGNMRRQQA